MSPTPRNSASIDEEERDTLLTHPLPPQRVSNRTLGAVLQIVIITAVGLLIALACGVFAYSLRGQTKSSYDFVHAPLPGLRNPLLLRYFGGMGPYIGGEYVFPPKECKVSQLHMMSRHGERYPTRDKGEIISQFASNISTLSNNFHSDLSFLNNWTLHTSNWLSFPQDQLDQETLTGPAAGSLRMFTLGSKFRARYDLWNFGNHNKATVWSCDSRRVIESAKYFASGFFGVGTDVSVEVIPEAEEQWGNSLTTTYVF
jgi:Histidine phosphatase superfamily (branch 2)